MSNLKIIISGGGTGGHIFPAIAIANAIKKIQPQTEFLFVGAQGKMEMEKVPAAGYKIEGLPIMGLQRSLSFKNLKFPFKLISSLWKAKKLLISFKPDVAIGVGGYASGPLLAAATAKKIPTLIQEQNSFAGITNRLLGKRVNTICVAFEGMEKFFPKHKIVLTGNPVRSEMVAIEGKEQKGIDFFQLNPNKKTLLIVGGSLGSWSINEGIEKSLEQWKDKDFQIVWQTGKLFHSRALNSVEGKESWVKVHDFIKEMDLAYAVADLVVSRAGAIAVSELSLVKKPSVLVPLPIAAEDHQTKNAMALVNSEAAILVRDKEVKQKLTNVVEQLIKDEEKLQNLSNNMRGLGHQNAADAIAKEVFKLVKNT